MVEESSHWGTCAVPSESRYFHRDCIPAVYFRSADLCAQRRTWFLQLPEPRQSGRKLRTPPLGKSAKRHSQFKTWRPCQYFIEISSHKLTGDRYSDLPYNSVSMMTQVWVGGKFSTRSLWKKTTELVVNEEKIYRASSHWNRFLAILSLLR